MKERSGVISMHLAVDMSEGTKMTMLYKIAEGFSKEEHYGLALARVVNLPPLVLEVADRVSKSLEARAAAKKRSSKASALGKKRKLVLGLRETLIQARDGPMDGKVLLSWMKKLQAEFVHRMEQIENEVEETDEEETDEEKGDDDESHVDLESQVDQDYLDDGALAD